MQYPSSYGTFKDKLIQTINNEVSKVPTHTSVMVKKYEKQIVKDPGNSSAIGKDNGLPTLKIGAGVDTDIKFGAGVGNPDAVTSNTNGQGGAVSVSSVGSGGSSSEGTFVGEVSETPEEPIAVTHLVKDKSGAKYDSSDPEQIKVMLADGWRIASGNDTSPVQATEAKVVVADKSSIPETSADGTQNYTKGRLLVMATTNSGHMYTTYADIATLYKDDRSNPQITAHPLNGQLNMLYTGFTSNVHKASNHKSILPTSNSSSPLNSSTQVTNPTKDKSLDKYFTVTTNADGATTLPPPLMP